MGACYSTKRRAVADATTRHLWEVDFYSGPSILPRLPTRETVTLQGPENVNRFEGDQSSDLERIYSNISLEIQRSLVFDGKGPENVSRVEGSQCSDLERIYSNTSSKTQPSLVFDGKGNEDPHINILCESHTKALSQGYLSGEHIHSNEGNVYETVGSRAMHPADKQVEAVPPMPPAISSHALNIREPAIRAYEGDIEKFLVTSLGGLLRSSRQQLSGSVPEGAVPPRDPVEITVMATWDPAFHPPHQAGEIPGPVYHFQPHGYLFHEDLVLQMSFQPLMPESAAQSSLTKTRVLYTATDVGEPARWETIYDNSKSDCRGESVVSAMVTRTATVLRLRSLCGFCTLRQLVPTTTFNMRVYVQYEADSTFVILTIMFAETNATQADRIGAPDNLGQLVAIHPVLIAQNEGSCITLDLRFYSGGWMPRRTSPRIEPINAGFLLEGAQPYRQVAVTWQGDGEPEPLFEVNVNMKHYDENMSFYVIHRLPGLQKSKTNGRGGSRNSDRPTPRPRSKPIDKKSVSPENDTSETADDRYALPAPAKEGLTAWSSEAPTTVVSADIPNGGDTVKSRTDVNCIQYHVTNNFYGSSNKESLAGRLCPPVIPHRVKAKIASCLDTERADGRDWQAFAEACGYPPSSLQRRSSPTMSVLEQLEAEPDYSLGKLLGILHSQDVGRDDVARVVEKEMANR